jgi:hypothetical protein
MHEVASFAKLFFFIATSRIPEEFSAIREARDRIREQRGWEVGRD